MSFNTVESDFWCDFLFKLSGQSFFMAGWVCSDMKGKKSPQFHHRLYADGTIDSICLSCFLTAARAENKVDLSELEAGHQCDDKGPFILTTNLSRAKLKRP
jgi:hypothetical protein